jgi:hypothetical protein
MSIEYKCKKCTKTYNTYKSLWRHVKLKHENECQQNTDICQQNIDNCQKNVNKILPIQIDKDTKLTCIKCDKLFKSRQGKWSHEKKCEINNNSKEENLEKIKEEILEYKKENLQIKKEMEKLKELLQKSLKIHPKTLNKINSQLNNNGVINNINIVQLGRENLSDILSSKEKRGILNRQVMGLNDLVELVHISGKYKKFMNVYITNLQNTIAYKFDEKMNNFIAVNKNELLNDLVDARLYDIEKFFEEIGPTLDSKKSEQIRKFIERMNNEEDELKGIKKEEIKLVLYNNLAKIKTNCNDPDIIKIEDNNIDI